MATTNTKDVTIPDKRRRYMTIQEVANHLGIGRSSAYDLITRGELRAKRFGKKNVRVHVSELARYESESDWAPLGEKESSEPR